MHLRNTGLEEIEKLHCDLLQAGTHCGLLQVLPASTQVALQDYSYSSTLAASISFIPTPLAIAVADIPTSDASISAHRDEPINPSTVKSELSISGEEIEQIMQATTAQAKCGLQHEQRAKRITGSQAGRIVTQKKKMVPLLIDILYPKPFTTPATE